MGRCAEVLLRLFRLCGSPQILCGTRQKRSLAIYWGVERGLGSRQQVSDEVRGLGSCNWERNAGKFPAKELPLNRLECLNRQLRSEANAFGLIAFHAKAVGASRCAVNVMESNKL